MASQISTSFKVSLDLNVKQLDFHSDKSMDLVLVYIHGSNKIPAKPVRSEPGVQSLKIMETFSMETSLTFNKEFFHFEPKLIILEI